MIPLIAAPYLPSYAATLVYMLQNTEYRGWPYLKWLWRTQDFSKVERRRQLQRTTAARILVLTLGCGMIAQILAGLLLISLWYWQGFAGGWAFGLALIVSYPVVWAHLILLPLIAGRIIIIKPRERWLVLHSEQIFKRHKGLKIAIAGSYGKTSMKELLLTVLGESKKVAATPANKNVSLSHAQFAKSLKGDEEILLIEYGEGAPGDVANFTRNTHPTHAVITGVAAAHLDRYKTVSNAGKDIFSVTHHLAEEQVFVNHESPDAQPFIKPGFKLYDRHGALGWEISHVVTTIKGLSLTMTKGQQILKLQSALLGSHNLGPLGFVAALAHQFGMTEEAIVKGVSQTKPFEHRMQPYQLNGAWVIDDTYNGNLEGIRAGTALLKELKARHKLYVTPGLVDQGQETGPIHQEVGRLIATSGADTVILIKHSVTDFIKEGLAAAHFQGELIVEPNPLDFYSNISQFVADGDLLLMQNDWPDNYA
jgi:UDP-N-acetylmuramoyl-tripeptide--D-alanyl-D-alanine ligase